MITATFTPLAPEAIERVAAIEQECGDVRWSRAQFEKELKLPASRFFVLQQDGDILGYAGYWKIGDEAQITNLVVASGERRKGWGRRLLNYLLERAQGDDCRQMTLELRSRNQAALALYQKSGFKACGRRPKIYTQPEDDAVLMEKQI